MRADFSFQTKNLRGMYTSYCYKVMIYQKIAETHASQYVDYYIT